MPATGHRQHAPKPARRTSGVYRQAPLHTRAVWLHPSGRSQNMTSAWIRAQKKRPPEKQAGHTGGGFSGGDGRKPFRGKFVRVNDQEVFPYDQSAGERAFARAVGAADAQQLGHASSRLPDFRQAGCFHMPVRIAPDVLPLVVKVVQRHAFFQLLLKDEMLILHGCFDEFFPGQRHGDLLCGRIRSVRRMVNRHRARLTSE